ncbi:hypothetical protein B0H17DRAFT_885424, partial [Mycena rosella]
MEMALPKDVPTLCAKGTKNLTRPDNVFCSAEFLDFFVSCDAYPALTPGTTDHFPVISIVDLVPPTVDIAPRRNWRATDWKEMNKMLGAELKKEPLVEGYASEEEVLGGLARLDAIIDRCVEKHVLLSKLSPHSKRWWTPELTKAKKARNALALKSYRKRELLYHPVHEEYRRARNNFVVDVKSARGAKWTDFLEGVDDTDVWTAGQLMKGAPTD